ncbi:MAG: histidine phosphatase family protein [Oscillospiraceae bacterium]|nr:histidine phosphatase family protein [Oscillospiraceae bacterium]
MIYIIRHGQTELNNKKALQGRSDHPLNDTGIAQAQEAAAMLQGIKFDAVYSSPLIRAIQTAKILAPELEPIIDERLIEMDYGPYEGMDLQNLAPEVITFFSDFIHNPAPDGMEQLGSVVDRAGLFIQEHGRTSGNILISTHAIAMKGILEYLTPESRGGYWNKYVGNCEVYITEYLPDGTWTVPIRYQPDEA